MAGGIYDGTYTENLTTEEIGLQITMAVPEGVTLVQTGVPLAAPMALPITTTVAQSDIATEKLILLQTTLGPVNVIFKKDKGFSLGKLESHSLIHEVAAPRPSTAARRPKR